MDSPASGLFRTGRVLEGGFLEAYFWEVQPISSLFRLGPRKAKPKNSPENPPPKTLQVHEPMIALLKSGLESRH